MGQQPAAAAPPRRAAALNHHSSSPNQVVAVDVAFVYSFLISVTYLNMVINDFIHLDKRFRMQRQVHETQSYVKRTASEVCACSSINVHLPRLHKLQKRCREQFSCVLCH